MLLVEFSLYLVSRFVGKCGGNGNVMICPNDGVVGTESVSDSDKYMSDETPMGSFTKFGSH